MRAKRKQTRAKPRETRYGWPGWREVKIKPSAPKAWTPSVHNTDRDQRASDELRAQISKLEKAIVRAFKCAHLAPGSELNTDPEGCLTCEAWEALTRARCALIEIWNEAEHAEIEDARGESRALRDEC